LPRLRLGPVDTGGNAFLLRNLPECSKYGYIEDSGTGNQPLVLAYKMGYNNHNDGETFNV